MCRTRFVLFLSVMYSILSCGQNPLERISNQIQKGILKTGVHYLSFFDNSLKNKLVAVNIIGQNDLLMEWTEGITDSYRIRVRLLEPLDSEYNFQLKSEIFSHLKGSSWTFDTETNTGILKWTPNSTFTGTDSAKKFSLPLHLEFKEKGSSSEEPVFVIKRDLRIIVHKSLDKPEIYKITTKYIEYEKLDDGNFYTKYGAKSLNLGYYDRIFADGNKIQTEIFNYPFLYSEDTYVNLKSQKKIGYSFRKFIVKDQLDKEVPDHLLGFVKQPLYHLEKKRQTDEDCDLDRAVSVNELINKNWCLAKLEDKKSVNFDNSIYVKQYQVPSDIAVDDLFYKVEFLHLCEEYHRISSDYIIYKKTEWTDKALCYLQAVAVQGLPFKVEENTHLYLFKNDGEFELVDQSDWDSVFYQLPEHIKWQLGGYQPVDNDTIKVHLVRNRVNHVFDTNKIFIYVRDYNYFKPSLVPDQNPKELLYWISPIDIDIEWISKPIEKEKEHHWKLGYDIKLLDHPRDKSDRGTDDFRQFNIDLKPDSRSIYGSPVSFDFNILPVVTVNYFEQFNPDKDVTFSINTRYVNGLEEWLSSHLSISNKITLRYIFSSNFLTGIHNTIPLKNIPFYKDSHSGDREEKVSDYLNIAKPRPGSNYGCSDAEIMSPFEGFCECSEFSEYEADDQIYIESTCSYKVELELNSEDLKNSDGQMGSSYWHYDYSLNKEKLSLDSNILYKKSSITSNVPIELEHEPFVPRYQPPSKVEDVYNGIHLFFNLQPHLQCINASNTSDKKCTIQYTLDKKPPWEILAKINKEEYFFSETGLQAHSSCTTKKTSPSGEDACSCSEKPFFSAVGIEIECLVPKNTKSSISVYLQTNNPYIYFLNTDIKHSKQPEHYKKTPVKVLEIF